MSRNELDARAVAYFDIMEQIDALTVEAEAIKDELKTVMVDSTTEELNGTGWRATWHNTTTTRFDSKAFKAAHADLYAAFSIKSTGTRFTMNRLTA
ncbi:MAG: hypothetical protein Q4E35_01265 [Eubacteriales bacterium]|nr:hypothetical protein [Eubacteriales bacterium]